MSSPVALFVAYPSTTPEGKSAKFDMNYYTKTHMSLIAKHWTPYGMLSWTITSFSQEDSLDGSLPPYCVQATVKFESIESMREALAKGSKETGADVANYTDVVPVIWVSRVVAEEGDCQGKKA